MKSIVIILFITFSFSSLAKESFKITDILTQYKCHSGEHQKLELRNSSTQKMQSEQHYLGKTSQNEILHISIIDGKQKMDYYSCLTAEELKGDIKVIHRFRYVDADGCDPTGRVTQGSLMIDEHFVNFVPLKHKDKIAMRCEQLSGDDMAFDRIGESDLIEQAPRPGQARDISSVKVY